MKSIDQAIAAVYRDDLAALSKLLVANLKPNECDDDGRTLLMHACLAETPCLEVVKLLIEKHADVNAVDSGQKWTALHFAARDQKAEVAKLLLENGAVVDVVDSFENTPLWRATMNKSPDEALIRLLLAHGADPNRKNRFGVSSLDSARNMGNSALADLFEKQ